MLMRSSRHIAREKRGGAIAVLSAFLIIVLLAMAAFAVDIGYLVMVRTELQRTADAAALAASYELIDEESLTGEQSMKAAMSRGRKRAADYAARNLVTNAAPSLDLNEKNDPEGEIVFGYLPNIASGKGEMLYANPRDYNAVRVRVYRNEDRNGLVPLFIARIFGLDGVSSHGSATAAVLKQIRGFQTPEDNSNLPILPITLDLESWSDLVNGKTKADDDDNGHDFQDQWKWDAESESVEPGSDGIREVSLYPTETGSSANRGTVNIGTDNNSTSFISRQIRNGIPPADLDYHGGSLTLDDYGELTLSGNPGLSASIANDLQEILGEPRIIPIFGGVTGDGNNAEFTIVRFAGVRIMEVVLSGGDKRLIVQPAIVVTKGAVEGPSGDSSEFIYAPARIVR